MKKVLTAEFFDGYVTVLEDVDNEELYVLNQNEKNSGWFSIYSGLCGDNIYDVILNILKHSKDWDVRKEYVRPILDGIENILNEEYGYESVLTTEDLLKLKEKLIELEEAI